MICSFADDDTEHLFHGGKPRRIPPSIRSRACRKLDLINAAFAVDDLRAPPGNRLEELHGDRKGQFSIRVNDQWRICFRFEAGSSFDVEIVDYH
jgi:toxin HigB-1